MFQNFLKLNLFYLDITPILSHTLSKGHRVKMNMYDFISQLPQYYTAHKVKASVSRDIVGEFHAAR